jgi:tripartite-type tricarboxylate transporter receptor subunit TctC
MRLAKVLTSAVFVNLLAAGDAALFHAAANAQDFPSRTITIVVPIPPGGGPDIFGRLIGQRLAAGLGKPVIVDNRPGATGDIGAEAVARAAPDGHTLLYTTAVLVLRQVVPPKPALDPQRDLAPVSITLRHPWFLVTHPSLPVRNVKDLLALGKAKPGDLTFGGGGIGGALHFAVELFKLDTKLDARYIPYQGAPRAQVALLSGEVQLAFLGSPVVRPHVISGKMRALGVSALKRSSVLPEVPTLHEAGVKDFEVLNWYGFFVPAKTPAATIARIHGEVVKALAVPEMKERAATEGFELVGSTTPSDFAAFFRSEVKKWSDVVQRSGMKFE